MRRRRQAADPWLLRNMVFVLGTPILVAAVALGLTSPGGGWWLVIAVVVMVYVTAVFAAMFVSIFRDVKKR
jgi:hypothetical protein